MMMFAVLMLMFIVECGQRKQTVLHVVHSESFGFKKPAKVAWSKLYRAWVSRIEFMYRKRT